MRLHCLISFFVFCCWSCLHASAFFVPFRKKATNPRRQATVKRNLVVDQDLLEAVENASFSTTIGIPNLYVSAIAGVAIVASFVSWRRQNELEKKCDTLQRELQELEKKTSKTNSEARQSERSIEEDSDSETTSLPPRPTLENQTPDDGGLVVKPIGTIRSIYRLCVGTPRQGLLAPNARGCIEMAKLGTTSASCSVSGLEGYSHIWVLFVFHLNTQPKDGTRRIKSKISPPALGGKKVGIFATRTPHRFNPIGITLCKLDRIEVGKKQRVTLHVSGLDLVDGTPVLDIKPYVPIYDSVEQDVSLPHWVAGGLATKREVSISSKARDDLQTLLEGNPNALQFYGPKQGQKTTEETIEYVLECIQQVLAIDVRSGYQTKKAREGKSQAERSERMQNVTTNDNLETADVCTQQLDNLMVRYIVEQESDLKRISSENSGAEDSITVISIQLLEENDGKQ